MAASIAVVLDHSGSMGYFGYMAPTQTDASTFINIMKPGDQLAVVGFNNIVNMIYPGTQNLQLIPQDQSVQDAARNAIMAVTSAKQTNMAGAVQMADNILAAAAEPYGMILLSDGIYNVGPNPVTVANPSIPIYTIALGPSAGTATLQDLASITGGVYNYAPDAWTLADIYFAIVGQANLAEVTTNQPQSVPAYRFYATPATIAAGNDLGYFAVSWTDQSIQFTPGTPVGNQVNITLRAPNGQAYSNPQAAGPGFVVYKIPNPQAGTWQVGSWVAAPTNFQSSVGAFEPDSPSTLRLTGPRTVLNAGQPAELVAKLDDAGKPLTNVSLIATLDSPAVSEEQALRLHADRLDRVSLDAGDLVDDIPEDRARLLKLMQEQPHLDLLPRTMIPIDAVQEDSGAYVIKSPGLLVPGSHTLRVSVRGYSPTTRSEFTRVQQLSFVVV